MTTNDVCVPSLRCSSVWKTTFIVFCKQQRTGLSPSQIAWTNGSEPPSKKPGLVQSRLGPLIVLFQRVLVKLLQEQPPQLGFFAKGCLGFCATSSDSGEEAADRKMAERVNTLLAKAFVIQSGESCTSVHFTGPVFSDLLSRDDHGSGHPRRYFSGLSQTGVPRLRLRFQ